MDIGNPNSAKYKNYGGSAMSGCMFQTSYPTFPSMYTSSDKEEFFEKATIVDRLARIEYRMTKLQMALDALKEAIEHGYYSS